MNAGAATLSNDRRLYRDEAFAHRGKTEPLNGLLRVTAPHEWVILVCLSIALLGLAAWGLLGSVEQSVSAQCVLVQPGDRYTIIAEAPGNVVDLLVAVGDEVQAGQPLARLRTPDLSREIALARSRVDILESKDAKMSDALDEARRELIELEAIAASGEYITTPFAGVISTFELSLGQAVEAGTTVANVRAGAGSKLEAIAVVLPESASRLVVGMEAQILTKDWDRKDANVLEAEVHYISPRPVTPPGWLTTLGLPTLAGSHMVRVALREAPPSLLADGDSCDVRIVLRRTSPVRLLLSTGSN